MANSIETKLYTAKASAPSNIAIVKYWGKKGIQEPVNPSVSFSLSKALSHTCITYTPGSDGLTIDFLFEGKTKASFLPKLNTFADRIADYLPFLKTGYLKIESSNTFPHSSGIASSASSMAALAKALIEIQMQLRPGEPNLNKEQLISNLARLGSGSACRSVYSGWALWGTNDHYKESSNNHAISINKQVHANFMNLQDSILVIRKGAKAVSSTVGHQLMDNHPYREGRIKQANKNTNDLLKALNEGDFDAFASICEEEALSLHGLMMSSSPAFTLLAPESLRAIKRIKKFRDHHHIPITFTIDAGPNIHIIYPAAHNKVIVPFINEHLVPLCENGEVIFDQIMTE